MTLYVPKLSEQSLCRLRRIAWAAGRPMTKTLDGIIAYIARNIDHKAICAACRDNSRCKICGLAEQEKAGRKAAKARKITLSELS
jgi:hypothetical protein